MNEAEKIIEAYKECGSVTGVVKIMGLSFHRVRKVLTGAGIVLNETHEKILELHEEGKSTAAIAKLLNISESTVCSYLPPQRPLYRVNQSENALKIAKWRAAKREPHE